ncbi:reverse transcriptase domain-containing protein [Tanacetum coccineum]
MVDSQPMEEETLGMEARDVGTETHRGPTKPVLQTQKTPSPSPAFIKENIDVLRTMIKEHNQQAKIKSTPRRLAYADSDKEALARGLLPRTRNHHTGEGREGWKTKAEPKRGLEGPSPEGKGLGTKKQARTLNTRKRVKLRRNIRVYEGNKDPKDHLSIFSAVAEQEEWLMPVWCKMFCQTLGGATQNWFDDLDPKSVYNFEELSQKFLEEFSQQKRYAKDPIEIHGIKGRQNKGLQAFIDQFKSESSHIKGVPLVLHNSAFMHGHGHPELVKKLNDKIPKTVDEMFKRVRDFI